MIWIRILGGMMAAAAGVGLAACGAPDTRTPGPGPDFEFVDGFGDFRGEVEVVRYGDGLVAKYGVGQGPMNNLVEYFDPQGRILLTQAHASEADPQTIAYLYDTDGELSSLRYIHLEMADSCCIGDDADSISMRRLIERFDRRLANGELDSSTCKVNLERDEGGRIMAITTFGAPGRIVSPPGESLAVKVIPSDNFWESDLTGGRFDMEISSLPK